MEAGCFEHITCAGGMTVLLQALWPAAVCCIAFMTALRQESCDCYRVSQA